MFEAHGTDGLEIFTWVVAGLIGLVAALVLTHNLLVFQKDKEDELGEELSDDEKLIH
ncbi:MAG: hypothetical protein ACLFUB_19650 [Cyclobacteriaceae bacterium]